MRLPPIRMAALAVLAFASTASGQATGRHFTIAPRAAMIAFDDASGIEKSAGIGLDATYQLTRMLGVGVSATFARPSTNGDHFIGTMDLGDTTFIYRATQPITVTDVNLSANLAFPMGRLTPFARAGIGGYTIYTDPQVSRFYSTDEGNSNRIQKMSLSLGGGVNFALSDRVGVLLDVRDMIFMNYNRDRLNPMRSAGFNTRFVQDFPAAPEKKETAHNLTFSIGFSFVPSGAGTEETR